MNNTTSEMSVFSRIMTRLSAPQHPPPWTMEETLALPVALALSMVVVGTLVSIFVLGEGKSPVQPLFGWTVGLLIIIVYILMTRRAQGRSPALKLWTDSPAQMPYILLLGVAAALTTGLIAALGGHVRVAAVLTGVGLTNDWGEWLLAAFFVIFVQPAAEGLVFQSVLVTKLRQVIGPWGGLLATTALYTLYYVLIYGAVLRGSDIFWYGILAPALMVFFLCCVRVYTDSTRAAIVAQMGMGIILVLVALLLTG